MCIVRALALGDPDEQVAVSQTEPRLLTAGVAWVVWLVGAARLGSREAKGSCWLLLEGG